jgi:hypothetical protein
MVFWHGKGSLWLDRSLFAILLISDLESFTAKAEKACRQGCSLHGPYTTLAEWDLEYVERFADRRRFKSDGE